MRLCHIFGALCILVLGAAFAIPVKAQTSCEDCAERYIELAQDRRLQAQIDYLALGDPLEMDRSKRGRKKTEDDEFDLSAPGRVGWLLISGVILAGIVYIVYQNSAGGLISFGNSPTDRSRKGDSPASGADDLNTGLPVSETEFLAQIEQMDDRRQALHLLSERLLSRAAEHAGIRLRQSWTARESLRALPRTMANLADLTHLSRHAELAWFGGRAVDEGVFEDCLARARIMMRPQAGS